MAPLFKWLSEFFSYLLANFEAIYSWLYELGTELSPFAALLGIGGCLIALIRYLFRICHRNIKKLTYYIDIDLIAFEKKFFFIKLLLNLVPKAVLRFIFQYRANLLIERKTKDLPGFFVKKVKIKWTTPPTNSKLLSC